MTEELKQVSKRVDDHEVEIRVLQQQHTAFEKASIEYLNKSAREEEGIHHRLDGISKDVHMIPQMVSDKLTACRMEMREEIGGSYAKKHEVVTPKALSMAAGVLAVILVAGMTVTMVVWDKIDDATHQTMNGRNP